MKTWEIWVEGRTPEELPWLDRYWMEKTFQKACDHVYIEEAFEEIGLQGKYERWQYDPENLTIFGWKLFSSYEDAMRHHLKKQFVNYVSWVIE